MSNQLGYKNNIRGQSLLNTPKDLQTYEHMRRSLTLLLCILLVQCAQEPETEHIQILDVIPQHIQDVENLTIYPGESEPAYSVELIPVQSFGETGEPFLTRIARSVVDDNGRIIIWDIDTQGGGFPPRNSLYVYNPDGTYHTPIGGRGKGPGEFEILISMYASAGNVYALDHTNQRLNVYNGASYSFERSTLVEQWSVHNHEAVQNLRFARLDTRNDGNHLVVFAERVPFGKAPVHKYLLMDTDGNVLNPEPLEFPAGFTIRPQTTPPSPSMTLPFMGSTITALSTKDELYSAWTRDFLIKIYDANGVYQSAIYYPVTGSPFNLEYYTGASRYNVRDIWNAFENSEEELPETNPVLADLMVDDEDRIWAAVHMGPHRENYEWWILAPSGKLLAKLQRPRKQRIFDIKNGYLYSKEIDEDTGGETVVKYRIELLEK